MKKEDVLAAFNHADEQEIPFSVWHHFTPNEHVEASEENGMLATDIKREPDYVQSVKPDFIKLMNDGFFTYRFNNVSDPTDLVSLAQIKPIGDENPWLKNQFKLISTQIHDLDHSTIIFSNIFSAVTLFKWSLVVDHPDEDLKTSDRIFADLYTENPEVVINALKTITHDIKKQIQVAHAAGVDGVLFSTQEIQDERIGQDFFEKVQKQLDAELISEINRYFKTSILHICGFDGAANHLPWFTDYQLPVVNWSTKFDGYSLSEGKKLFKDKVIFGGLGNTTDDVLFTGNREQIQSYIDHLIDEAGTQGVIIGADCTVPRDTPVAHIQWAAEAAHSYSARKHG